MDTSEEVRATLNSPGFKRQFRDTVVEEARRTHTSLHYIDDQGRYVEEWPATGELYEVCYDSATDQTIRLRSLPTVESIVL